MNYGAYRSITGHQQSVIEDNDAFALKEPAAPYTVHLEHEMGILSRGNRVFIKVDHSNINLLRRCDPLLPCFY